MHPPDPDMRKAALADGPVSQTLHPCSARDSSDAARDFQALKLRRLYCFCHATACTIASLAFSVSR